VQYRVEVRRNVQKSLAKLNANLRERIAEALRRLGDEPRPPGARKLKDREGWRVRVGDYRIIYKIHDDRLVIVVVRIAHRSSVYD
jgi:mRNA interferase RelE/StbE